MPIYDKILDTSTPLIMGILNITPDSFSDGGKFFNFENACLHAEKLIKDGADIIDVGGESTRPGSEKINPEIEKERVLPVIKYIKKTSPNMLISVDTTKSTVAEEAVNLGANIVNDISGGTFDENIFKLTSRFDIPCVIMHIKGTPRDMQQNPYYDDVLEEVYHFFDKQISKAKDQGVKKIILDPGIGFGKRVEDNFKLINNLSYFTDFEYPILLGLSRKSFLGNSLKLGVNERTNASIIAETIGVMKGAKIIRTHNVKNAVEMKQIMYCINNSENIIHV